MNLLGYDKYTFTDHDIVDVGFNKEKSLLGNNLTIDTLDFTVVCEDPDIIKFTQNTPVLYSVDGNRVGNYYLRTVDRIGPDQYRLSAASAVVLLSVMRHPGGIYSGVTLEELVKSICGTLPVIVKSSLADVALYGWLPYSTARNNLAQVLFAAGAYLGVDLNGVLRVETLWDGVASHIFPNRMFIGGSVKYKNKVTAVNLTEHQYVTGTETARLFEGTAQDGDIITFSEPMHTLSASGFSIKESGANYAILSAGTGTLTGRKYIHNTRIISKSVSDSATQNVVTVEDQTLISLVNSNAAAERLAAYYKCTEEIDNDVVSEAEKPGHIVMVYHPYDNLMVKATIQSMDVSSTSFLRSTANALVGFVPPASSGRTSSVREVLTSGTTFTVPEGVTHIRAVLIGGGSGGGYGGSGSPGGVGTYFEYHSEVFENTMYWLTLGLGGSGGNGGSGGTAGKVLEVNLDVEPGQEISMAIGAGGAAGSSGGNTTFAGHSSANGTVTPGGYVDPITGDTYATPGDTGAPGGSGNGWVGGTPSRANAQSIRTGSYTGGYGPGANSMQEYHSSSRFCYYIMSGGGARNANGSTSGGSIGDIRSCRGGNGANATYVPPKPTTYGKGGTGGSGGGGGGGSAAVESRSAFTDRPSGGSGGSGTRGGPGADGCIILYYDLPVQTKSGQFVTRDKHWLLGSLRRRFIV